MTRVILHRSVRAFLLIMYPSVVLAAQGSLGDQLHSYSLSTIGLVGLLITAGGMTGLLHRLKQAYEDTGELKHPKLFVASNLVGAFTAGIVGLFLGEWLNFPGTLHSVFIIITAYVGTLFLEKLFDWFVDKYFPAAECKLPLRRETDFIRELPSPPKN